MKPIHKLILIVSTITILNFCMGFEARFTIINLAWCIPLTIEMFGTFRVKENDQKENDHTHEIPVVSWTDAATELSRLERSPSYRDVQKITLRKYNPNIENVWYPAPPVISVNGRWCDIFKHKISYDELVKIAYPLGKPGYDPTITYSKGPSSKTQGILAGGEIQVVDGMIFNVTDTSEA
jgi:hypothetical protein